MRCCPFLWVVEQSKAQRQQSGASPVGEEAEVADEHEARGSKWSRKRRRNSSTARVTSRVLLPWAEGAQLCFETPEKELRDAAIISTTQRVEHYEIAGYSVARTFADVMGHAQIARLLQESLLEEKSADMVLTEVARTVNAAVSLHISA